MGKKWLVFGVTSDYNFLDIISDTRQIKLLTDYKLDMHQYVQIMLYIYTQQRLALDEPILDQQGS